MTDIPIGPGLPGTYTVSQAADYLGITKAYLHNMRHFQRGPSFKKISGRVYYGKSALDEWQEARTAKGRKGGRPKGAKDKEKRKPREDRAAA